MSIEIIDQINCKKKHLYKEIIPLEFAQYNQSVLPTGSFLLLPYDNDKFSVLDFKLNSNMLKTTEPFSKNAVHKTLFETMTHIKPYECLIKTNISHPIVETQNNSLVTKNNFNIQDFYFNSTCKIWDRNENIVGFLAHAVSGFYFIHIANTSEFNIQRDIHWLDGLCSHSINYNKNHSYITTDVLSALNENTIKIEISPDNHDNGGKHTKTIQLRKFNDDAHKFIKLTFDVKIIDENNNDYEFNKDEQVTLSINDFMVGIMTGKVDVVMPYQNVLNVFGCKNFCNTLETNNYIFPKISTSTSPFKCDTNYNICGSDRHKQTMFMDQKIRRFGVQINTADERPYIYRDRWFKSYKIKYNNKVVDASKYMLIIVSFNLWIKDIDKSTGVEDVGCSLAITDDNEWLLVLDSKDFGEGEKNIVECVYEMESISKYNTVRIPKLTIEFSPGKFETKEIIIGTNQTTNQHCNVIGEWLYGYGQRDISIPYYKNNYIIKITGFRIRFDDIDQGEGSNKEFITVIPIRNSNSLEKNWHIRLKGYELGHCLINYEAIPISEYSRVECYNENMDKVIPINGLSSNHKQKHIVTYTVDSGIEGIIPSTATTNYLSDTFDLNYDSNVYVNVIGFDYKLANDIDQDYDVFGFSTVLQENKWKLKVLKPKDCKLKAINCVLEIVPKTMYLSHFSCGGWEDSEYSSWGKYNWDNKTCPKDTVSCGLGTCCCSGNNDLNIESNILKPESTNISSYPYIPLLCDFDEFLNSNTCLTNLCKHQMKKHILVNIHFFENDSVMTKYNNIESNTSKVATLLSLVVKKDLNNSTLALVSNPPQSNPSNTDGLYVNKHFCLPDKIKDCIDTIAKSSIFEFVHLNCTGNTISIRTIIDGQYYWIIYSNFEYLELSSTPPPNTNSNNDLTSGYYYDVVRQTDYSIKLSVKTENDALLYVKLSGEYESNYNVSENTISTVSFNKLSDDAMFLRLVANKDNASVIYLGHVDSNSNYIIPFTSKTLNKKNPIVEISNFTVDYFKNNYDKKQVLTTQNGYEAIVVGGVEVFQKINLYNIPPLDNVDVAYNKGYDIKWIHLGFGDFNTGYDEFANSTNSYLPFSVYKYDGDYNAGDEVELIQVDNNYYNITIKTVTNNNDNFNTINSSEIELNFIDANHNLISTVIINNNTSPDFVYSVFFDAPMETRYFSVNKNLQTMHLKKYPKTQKLEWSNIVKFNNKIDLLQEVKQDFILFSYATNLEKNINYALLYSSQVDHCIMFSIPNECFDNKILKIDVKNVSIYGVAYMYIFVLTTQSIYYHKMTINTDDEDLNPTFKRLITKLLLEESLFEKYEFENGKMFSDFCVFYSIPFSKLSILLSPNNAQDFLLLHQEDMNSNFTKREWTDALGVSNYQSSFFNPLAYNKIKKLYLSESDSYKVSTVPGETNVFLQYTYKPIYDQFEIYNYKEVMLEPHECDNNDYCNTLKCYDQCIDVTETSGCATRLCVNGQKCVNTGHLIPTYPDYVDNTLYSTAIEMLPWIDYANEHSIERSLIWIPQTARNLLYFTLDNTPNLNACGVDFDNECYTYIDSIFRQSEYEYDDDTMIDKNQQLIEAIITTLTFLTLYLEKWKSNFKFDDVRYTFIMNILTKQYPDKVYLTVVNNDNYNTNLYNHIYELISKPFSKNRTLGFLNGIDFIRSNNNFYNDPVKFAYHDRSLVRVEESLEGSNLNGWCNNIDSNVIRMDDDLFDLCACFHKNFIEETREKFTPFCKDDQSCLYYVDNMILNSYECMDEKCNVSFGGKIKQRVFDSENCVANNFVKCDINIEESLVPNDVQTNCLDCIFNNSSCEPEPEPEPETEPEPEPELKP